MYRFDFGLSVPIHCYLFFANNILPWLMPLYKFWSQEMWVSLSCFSFSELFWLFSVSYNSPLILEPSCQCLWSQLEFTSRFCWIWRSVWGIITVSTKLIFLVHEHGMLFISKYFIHFDTVSRIVFLVLFWILDSRIERQLIFYPATLSYICSLATYV